MFRRRRASTPQTTDAPSQSATSPVVTVNDTNFLDQTAGRVTVVDFWAPWCGPCHAFAPTFESAAIDYDGRVTFGKCDVDANPATAGLLRIQSIPTLIVFDSDGSELERVSGALPRRHLDTILQRVAPATTT